MWNVTVFAQGAVPVPVPHGAGGQAAGAGLQGRRRVGDPRPADTRRPAPPPGQVVGARGPRRHHPPLRRIHLPTPLPRRFSRYPTVCVVCVSRVRVRVRVVRVVRVRVVRVVRVPVVCVVRVRVVCVVRVRVVCVVRVRVVRVVCVGPLAEWQQNNVCREQGRGR